jgi:hypothetical protein
MPFDCAVEARQLCWGCIVFWQLLAVGLAFNTTGSAACTSKLSSVWLLSAATSGVCCVLFDADVVVLQQLYVCCGGRTCPVKSCAESALRRCLRCRPGHQAM